MNALDAVILFHVSMIVVMMSTMRTHANQIEMTKSSETQRLWESIFWNIAAPLIVIFNSYSLIGIFLDQITK